MPADLTHNNMVTLSYDQAFSFGDVTKGPLPGSLFIQQNDNVPGPESKEQGSVGIGMSGAGTFVVATQPTGNGGVQFEVHASYWIALGSYDQGTVITENILTYPVEVDFGPGLFNADCTFTGHDWEISFS